MNDLAIGGVALLGVVIGSAVTFLGQKWLADREIARHRTGVVRAMISELMQNGATVTGVLYGGVAITQFSSETWRAARFELAQFLPRRLYDDIDFLYVSLPSTKTLANGPITEQTQGLLEKWLEMLKSARRGLRDLPESDAFRDLDSLEEIVDRIEMEHGVEPREAAN
jgi:hypothetical protein